MLILFGDPKNPGNTPSGPGFPVFAGTVGPDFFVDDQVPVWAVAVSGSDDVRMYQEAWN